MSFMYYYNHLKYLCSLIAKDIVQKLLKVNPGDRLTIDQVVEHPWFQVRSLSISPALITQ